MNIQGQVYQEAINILTAQIARRNQIIRELLDFIDQFPLDAYPPTHPSRQLWDRAQEAVK